MSRSHDASSLVCWPIAFLLVALVSGTSGARAGTVAAQPRELFAWSPEAREEQPQAGPAEAENQRVTVDLTALTAGSEQLSLELFSGRHLSRLRLLERHAPGELTWFGDLDGSSDLRVVLTLTPGAVAGTLFADDGTYELRPEPEGDSAARLIRLDSSRLPGCGGGVAGTSGSSLAVEPPAVDSAELGEQPRALRPLDLDVLAFYTAAAGSDLVVRARIRNAIDAANAALVNSRADVRFRLLDTVFTSYTESQSILTDLGWLSRAREVRQLRARYRADLVALITGPGRESCGESLLLTLPRSSSAGDAFSVTAADCLGEMALAHQLGHNLGLNHDPDNAGNPQQFYPWSHGHFVDGLFRTVMAVPEACLSGCPQIPYFSNPEVSVQGEPTGIANQRDNYRSLQLNAPVVSGFGDGLVPSKRPTTPGGLGAEVAPEGIRLSWVDRSDNELGFRIYRGAPGGSQVLIGTVAANVQQYLDLGALPATTYRYVVAAFNDRWERGSGPVDVTVPAMAPLTAELMAAPAEQAQAGDVTHFAARIGGGVAEAVRTVRWSFSPDGLAFSPEPCGDGLYCADHLFSTAGPHTVRVQVEGSFGRSAQASATLQVSGPDAGFATQHSLIQSVIFGPRGDTGTFRSNCWSHNLSDAPTLIDLAYLPRGVTNASPMHRQITLLPGQTLFLDNVLASVFGEQGSVGALRLSYQRSDLFPGGGPEVRTFCRSFVELLDGTSFGQLVPEDPEETWSAAPRSLPGILEDDYFSASLQAANLDDRPGRVDMELLDVHGQRVGVPAVFQLGRGTVRLRSVRDLFPQARLAVGPFTVRFASDGIRFAASATLLEKGSEDQIFVPAGPPVAADVVVIPRVTTAPGQFDAFLVSQLVVYNPSAQPTVLELDLWQRGQANLDPLTAQRTVPAGGLLSIDNLVSDLFGLDPGVGALQVRWENVDGIAPQVLTYATNQSSLLAPRFGTLVNGQLASAAGQHTLGFGAELSARFRSSYGAVNLSTAPTRLQVTLRRADGTQLAQAELALRPQQHLERTLEGIFQDTALGEGSVWTVETTVLSGGPVLTYLAHINASGDVFFVPDTVVPEP